MMNLKQAREKLQAAGLDIPSVLLPAQSVDLEKWAVIACDQYTSQPDYWEKAEELTRDAPSALRLIFPEVWLGKGEEEQRIKTIHKTMREYLEMGVFAPAREGLLLTRRETAYGRARTGLMVLLDLEKYDYTPGAHPAIRPTEKTIVSRIPPRQKIRRGAPMELPHILILADDPDRTLMDAQWARHEKLEKAYETNLMLDGGKVSGYWLDEQGTAELADALEKLLAPAIEKDGDKALLFAVGDGNHSLATAKACYEEVRAQLGEAALNHPSRYALAELVNLYAEGLPFEPIHRVLFKTEPEKRIETLMALAKERGFAPEFIRCKDAEEVCAGVSEAKVQTVGMVSGKVCGMMQFALPKERFAVGTLQQLLDESMVEGEELDFVHGAKATVTLGEQEGNLGMILPAPDRGELFAQVIDSGVLPRKTFSLGETDEKRFYLESRMILPK